jgi:hypothetical protein
MMVIWAVVFAIVSQAFCFVITLGEVVVLDHPVWGCDIDSIIYDFDRGGSAVMDLSVLSYVSCDVSRSFTTEHVNR